MYFILYATTIYAKNILERQNGSYSQQQYSAKVSLGTEIFSTKI